MSSGSGTCSTTKSVIPCVGCGEMFPGRARDDGKQNKFCKPRCKQIYRGILRTCKRCEREFVSYYKYDYCTRKCYEADHQKEVVKRICSSCGEVLIRAKSQDLRKGKDPDGKRFCNQKCWGTFYSAENHPLYRGNRKADRGRTWRRKRREFLEVKIRCRFCRRIPKGRERHVDHIVPYRCYRAGAFDPNDKQNLWLLCRSCHCRKTMAERLLYICGVGAYVEAMGKISPLKGVGKELLWALRMCKMGVPNTQ